MEEIATLPWLYADIYCPFQDMVDQLFAQRSSTINVLCSPMMRRRNVPW